MNRTKIESVNIWDCDSWFERRNLMKILSFAIFLALFRYIWTFFDGPMTCVLQEGIFERFFSSGNTLGSILDLPNAWVHNAHSAIYWKNFSLKALSVQTFSRFFHRENLNFQGLLCWSVSANPPPSPLFFNWHDLCTSPNLKVPKKPKKIKNSSQ